jgi:hypothetical protein
VEGEIDEAPPIADAPAIPEGPAAPGSADAFIDDVNAGPQVAAPGGGELPDVDETLAEPAPTPDAVPGVPNSPPGASPPPIPGAPPAPGTPPAIPGAGGAVPRGPVTPEKVIGEQQKLEEDIARSKRAAAERESTASRQEATDQAAERQAEADRRAAIQLEVDKRNAAAQADLDKKTAFYEKNHELRDPRASQSTWDKVRMGIAVAFGGLGAAFSAAAGGSNKNMVLQQMTDNLDREQARQKANIENARDDVVVARANLAASQSQGRQQIADADDARRILIQDEDAKHVARLRVAEAQGRAELEAQGIPAAQINADSRIVQLQQARIAAERTAADDAAKRAEEAARAQYYLARGAQAAKKAKGGGGGGGGTSALEAMQATANAPGATVLDVAIAGRKAHLSEKEALKQASVVWQRRTGDQRAGMQNTRTLDTEVSKWASTNGVPKAIATRDQLETLKEKLADPKVDPVTVMSSLMEFDKAVKGGTATKSSFDAIVGHLGGLKERIEGWIAKGETGNLAPDQIDIVRHAVDAGIKASNGEAKHLAQSFDERFRNSSDPSIAAQRDSLFERFGIKGAATGKKAPPEIIEQAKAEVARNGKYAASARKLLQQNGINP